MKIYPSNMNHLRFTKPTNQEIQEQYYFPCSITVLNQSLYTAEVFYYDGEGNEFPQGRFNIPSDYLFQKALLRSDTAPTIKGLYPLIEIGVYTNLGGINATTGNLNFASFDGTTWKLITVDIANNVVDNLTSTSTTDSLSSNMGKVLNEKIIINSTNQYLDDLLHIGKHYYSKTEPMSDSDTHFAVIKLSNVVKGEFISIPDLNSTINNVNILNKNGDEVNIVYQAINGRFVFHCLDSGDLYIDYYSADSSHFISLLNLNHLIYRQNKPQNKKEFGNIISDLQSIFTNNNKTLTQSQSYNDFEAGIMLVDGFLDETTTQYFKHSNKISSSGLHKTIIDVDFNTLNENYRNLIIYDINGILVSQYNLKGKYIITVPFGYSAVISIENSIEVKLSTEEFLASNNYTIGKSIILNGTSIPAGGGHYEIMCERLGYIHENKAFGGSYITNKGELSLSMSVSEKNNAGYSNTTAIETSFENRLLPYIENKTAWVFDHGYNDGNIIFDEFIQILINKGKITTFEDLLIANDINGNPYYHEDYLDFIMENDINWFSEDKSSFFGAFNFLRRKVLEVNPYVKIIVVSHLENKSCRMDIHGKNNGLIGKVIYKAQKLIAEHYGFAFIDIASLTGWSKIAPMPNTSTFIADINSTHGTSYIPYWTDSSGNISTFQFFNPDGVHPQSDFSGKTKEYLSTLLVKEFMNLI